MKTFLFLHGWGVKGNSGNWQNILAEKLAGQGHKVIYPTLPNANEPKLEEWLKSLEEALLDGGCGGGARGGGELTVATHSLGGVLWMHYLSRNGLDKPKNEAKSVPGHEKTLHVQSFAGKVYLVSPPFNDCGIEEIKDFFPLPRLSADFAKNYLLIHSDNDPYIPLKDFEEFAGRFGIPTYLIKNAGHINVKSGYGEFAWMEKQLTI